MEANPIENFFIKAKTPNKEVYLALRYFILNNDPFFTEHWKYGTPFYYYKNKPFAYFHHNKINGFPYLGIARGNQIEHHLLFKGNRKKMKVLEINPMKDLPMDEIKEVIDRLKKLY
ncbi:MAG: DUF1801 domain-containing protein [Salibacteraceae bacterium]